MKLLLLLIKKLDGLFIKWTSKNLSSTEIKREIELRSQKREELMARKKQELEAKKQEQARIAQEKKEQEKQEILAIL